MSKKTGFYWHCHHDKLLEFCYDYDGRVAFIKKNKPVNEIPERLHRFQKVKGKLPDEIIKTMQTFCKARQTYCEASQAYFEAGQAYDRTLQTYHKDWQAYSKARRVYNKAWRQAYFRAWHAYCKAGRAYDKSLSANKNAIENLHAKECKNCSWNGKQLAFNGSKK